MLRVKLSGIIYAQERLVFVFNRADYRLIIVIDADIIMRYSELAVLACVIGVILIYVPGNIY